MNDQWKNERIAELYGQLVEYRKLCQWKWVDGRWQTACGGNVTAENDFSHCPHCGRKFRLGDKPDVEVKLVQTAFVLD